MKTFKRNAVRVLPLFVVMILLSIAGSTFSKPSLENARSLVQAAAKVMGGEQRLRALKSIKLETIGHTHALEESERPEGPCGLTSTNRFPNDTQKESGLAHLERSRFVSSKEGN